ncbi:MAG: hypothetical protein ACOY7P_15415 [Pseudomonadota bacterium]
MKTLFSLLLIALLTGCASPFTRVDKANVVVRERMEVAAEGDWNRYTPPGSKHREIWTQHGMPLDVLVFFTGVADGDALNDQVSADKKPPKFRATMSPEDVAALFENLVAGDGGRFELLQLEPHAVAGSEGFRFSFNYTARGEEIERSGLAVATVRDTRLYALVYAAPRGRYFERGRPGAERVMDSLRLVGKP